MCLRMDVRCRCIVRRHWFSRFLKGLARHDEDRDSRRASGVFRGSMLVPCLRSFFALTLSPDQCDAAVYCTRDHFASDHYRSMLGYDRLTLGGNCRQQRSCPS